MPEQPLMTAARAVCSAVEAHARACLDDAGDVAAIIGAGKGLVAAMLEYERRLSADTGWSNPARHLGRLPMYTSDDDFDTSTSSDAAGVVRVRVTANYLVDVKDEELVADLVEGRGGERPTTSEDAVRFLFEADSWDVRQYPPGAVRLLEAGVDISIVGADR